MALAGTLSLALGASCHPVEPEAVNSGRQALATHTWELAATAVSIGRPAVPVVRFGTLPGEPFSALQAQLRDGATAGPHPLLFGYTNGYLGYLPDDSAPTMRPM